MRAATTCFFVVRQLADLVLQCRMKTFLNVNVKYSIIKRGVLNDEFEVLLVKDKKQDLFVVINHDFHDLLQDHGGIWG